VFSDAKYKRKPELGSGSLKLTRDSGSSPE
jgi:hypothetical protein